MSLENVLLLCNWLVDMYYCVNVWKMIDRSDIIYVIVAVSQEKATYTCNFLSFESLMLAIRL